MAKIILKIKDSIASKLRANMLDMPYVESSFLYRTSLT